MALFDYFSPKTLRLAIGLVILLILFPVLFRVIFAAKDEISLGAGAGFSTCGDFYIAEASERSTCTTTYNISLGNTGSNHQALVTIDLTSVPENNRLSWNSLDIVATNRAAIEPRITNRQLGETLHFAIQDLQPNRLVEISISSQGVASAARMENIAISVSAEGSIVETSPRMTVALRFLSALGGIFSF